MTTTEEGVILTPGDIKKMTIQATIIRANGDIEHYGTISGFHKNKFYNAIMQIYIKLHRYMTEIKLGKYISKHR